MQATDDILGFWRQLVTANQTGVLATVVKTQGSSYRLPGARLLLSESGEHVGTVSGGCLEEELLRKAWWLTRDGPTVRRYDTTTEEDPGTSGYGLGCNGVVYLLLERIHPAERSPLTLFSEVRQCRRPAAIAHVIAPSGYIGRRLSLDAHGSVQHNVSETALASELHLQALSCLREETSRTLILESGTECFVELLTPAIHLVLFGAGNDAIPLARLAGYLGWQVSVFDGRAHYAQPGKFPGASQVVVRVPGSSAPPIDPWTVGVIMTHSYSQDLDILKTLAKHRLRYLGILGPRKRTLQLISDAGLNEKNAPALHTPVGLDIGADGPEQVALAVVAEIQSVLNGRSAGFLRDRTGSIHSGAADPAENKMFSPSTVCA